MPFPQFYTEKYVNAKSLLSCLCEPESLIGLKAFFSRSLAIHRAINASGGQLVRGCGKEGAWTGGGGIGNKGETITGGNKRAVSARAGVLPVMRQLGAGARRDGVLQNRFQPSTLSLCWKGMLLQISLPLSREATKE